MLLSGYVGKYGQNARNKEQNNRPCREDVDVLVVEGERPGLDGVGDVAVEHAHAADPRAVRDPHAALGVVGRRGNLPGAAGTWKWSCVKLHMQ